MTTNPGDGALPGDGTSGDAPAAVIDPVEGPDGTQPRRRRRWPLVLGIVALVLALIAGAAAVGLWYLAKNLEGNVTTIEGFVADAPVESYDPINVLIMGSDYRGGGNTVGGETDEINGQRSDTTLLVHVSEGRDRALVVSIPRDTRLELPECASESGQWRPTAKFNAAFSYGGPACTVEAVEELTGATINHAVVVDFLGFKTVVDTLGGVDVCLEEDVYDPDSGLDLEAGWSRVSGDQALAFVRARKALGDGSDIDRIERQQQFLSSAIRQATSRELLLKPVTMYKMLDAVTGALTVDEGLDDLGEMASMANSLRGMRPENITFVTMPFYYSDDSIDVLVNEPVANEIWEAVLRDEPWPKPAAAGQAALTVAPGDISVLVANGTGVDNGAADAAGELEFIGFGIAGLAAADRTDYTAPVIVYNPADAEAARTLQAAVPGSVLRSDAGATAGQLQLIVGSAFDGVTAVDVPRVPAGTGADPLPVTADTSICSS